MNTSQSIVSTWLAAAGRLAGHELALGADGHCTIAFGNGLQCMVEVPEGSELVFLYVPLRRLPDDLAAQARLMKSALALNQFGLETGGGVISYDDRTEYLLLTFSARLDMLDETLFGRLLGDLLDVAVRLHARIEEVEHSADAAPELHVSALGVRV
jgi:hypothetical protein